MAAPFRFLSSKPVSTQVSLEPVYNALTSLSLLHVTDQLSHVDPWLVQTAAALTPEQIHHNRLVFEGFGDALTTDQDWPDFPAYLDDLARQSPAHMRDRVLEQLIRSRPDRPQKLNSSQEILANTAMFIGHMQRVYLDDSIDVTLLTEAHALLNDPPAMHDLIISHLRTLWFSYLALEWQRRQPFLQSIVDVLSQREWPNTSAADAIRAFIGRELPDAISMELEGVQHIVFTISPHIGPFASRFGSDTTIWVFVRARVSAGQRPNQRQMLDLPLRQAPIKPKELVGPFSALADETRLQILELLAEHGELLAQDLIARLELSQSSISRHLKQLVASGFLLERRGEGANKLYRLDHHKIDWTFFAFKQLLANEMPKQRQDVRGDVSLELRRFLDSAGRLANWPSKQRDKTLVLKYLVSKFELDREYTEKEVNTLLAAQIAGSAMTGQQSRADSDQHGVVDVATLRRYLCDERLLDRSRDGARYWRPKQEQG